MADPTTPSIPDAKAAAKDKGEAAGKAFTDSLGSALALGFEEIQRIVVHNAVDLWMFQDNF